MTSHLSRLFDLPTPDEMIEGYLDGYSESRLEYPDQSNRSEAYRHGWLNGRDDRVKQPRASFETIADQAVRIIEAEQRR